MSMKLGPKRIVAAVDTAEMAVASGRIAGERKDNRLAKRPQTPGSRVREMKRKRISPVLCLFVLITGGLPTAPAQIPPGGTRTLPLLG